jgi:small subunit ribosomal protein S7
MRKKKKEDRNIGPDRIYDSILVSRFINNVMKEGKKSTAEKVVYDSFKEIEKQTKKPPLEVFELAIKNIAPLLEVKSRRIGGASYQVPREVRGDRKITLAIRWMLTVARAQKGSSMANRIANEIIAASKNEGAAIKKRSDTHRMAEANRAFAHFSW